jgi:hypothetical protein
MSRMLIDANKIIFSHLDNHCALRGVVLSNSGSPRWIASKSQDRHFMMHAKLGEVIDFGPTRKLVRFNLSEKSFLCSVGFEQNHGYFRDSEMDIDAAFLTVILSELSPKPAASATEIREIVEWSDKSDGCIYIGHEYESVASLFPQIRVYSISKLDKEIVWNTFFRACVDECELASSWIEGELANTLRSMCELDQERVPYKVLCRSIFDGDKSSFFLALYRCLEALYGYSSAHSLSKSLEITKSWGDIATALEQQLGWHPREEGSLTRIIKFASRHDLTTILTILKMPIPSNDELIVDKAAKAIYDLRNSIVHYRPAQRKLDINCYNWPIICKAMAGIVLDVYEAVFAGRSA